ncbi:MAG: proline racemase family protein, partial [Acidimicrobiales bacterium]
VLPGATMLERAAWLVANRDDLRTLLMYEPRGHSAMSGSILQPPADPRADVGVVFIEVSGCLPMCGHGAIGTVVAVLETGMVEAVEPTTVVRLDTPAGLVEAEASVSDGAVVSVRLRNVDSFLLQRDAKVELAGAGSGAGAGALAGAAALELDVAYGGNFYAILPAARLGLDVVPSAHHDLVAAGLRVMNAVNAQLELAHPLEPAIAGCRHVILTGPSPHPGAVRSTVVIHPGWLDRSPCGTGTSALMAALHARGELGIGEPFVHESIIGSRFVGELIGETMVGDLPGVVPTVTGRAWVTGLNQYVLDPTDPFPAGFLLSGP